MSSSIEDKEDVMVFWDYETSASSSSAAGAISTYEMVKNIRSAVAPYGPLKSIRLYWDYDSHPIPSATLRTRSELSASGVTVIDCPAEGRNSAATKKMLVDMIFHAWDISFPFTFVVITGDRDLAYALAMLRMKTFQVVLISPAGSHSDLTSQASVQLDWSRTILGVSGGFNEDDTFQTASHNQTPSPTHVPKSSNSSRPGEEKPLRPDLPAATSHNSSLSHKPSAFSSTLDHGFNFNFPSPNPPVGLGDGPLFPHPTSASRKPLHSRSESLPDFMKATPFANKGKDVLEPNRVDLRPPSSGSRLRSSTSIFEPFNDDDDDDDDDKGLSIPPPSPPKLIIRKSPPSSISKLGQNSLSSKQISKPGDVNASKPSRPPEEEPTRLSNETQARTITPSFPVIRQTGTMPKPPQIIVPLTPVTKPQKAAKSQKPKPPPPASGPSKSKSSKVHPPKWVPLIETLKKHSGVLSKAKVAPKLLTYYPNAFQIAGTTKWKPYLNAAIAAGIVTKSQVTGGIHLEPPYRN